MINSCCSQACSEPLRFQDSILHAVDVGREAWGDWTPNGPSKFLQDIGPSLVIVCIQYNHPESAVQHSDLLEEVVTHCDSAGVPYLLVDVRDTPRPKMAAALYPNLPMCGDW